MSDVMPNYDLEKKRLELERSQLLLNVQSQEFRIMQLEDEKIRLTQNIEATHTSIEEIDKQLKELNV